MSRLSLRSQAGCSPIDGLTEEFLANEVTHEGGATVHGKSDSVGTQVFLIII